MICSAHCSEVIPGKIQHKPRNRSGAVTCRLPWISIRNAAGAQRGRLSLLRLCVRLSVCQSGQRVDFFARAGGAIVLNRTWWAQRVLVGQPSRPGRLCVLRACSGSRCSERESQKGLMDTRGCKSTASPHPSEPGGLERKEIGAALSSTPWARGSHASDDRA